MESNLQSAYSLNVHTEDQSLPWFLGSISSPILFLFFQLFLAASLILPVSPIPDVSCGLLGAFGHNSLQATFSNRFEGL